MAADAPRRFDLQIRELLLQDSFDDLMDILGPLLGQSLIELLGLRRILGASPPRTRVPHDGDANGQVITHGSALRKLPATDIGCCYAV